MSGARTWRTLHLAVVASTGEILASDLASNEEGADDGGPVAPKPVDPSYKGG